MSGQNNFFNAEILGQNNEKFIAYLTLLQVYESQDLPTISFFHIFKRIYNWAWTVLLNMLPVLHLTSNSGLKSTQINACSCCMLEGGFNYTKGGVYV